MKHYHEIIANSGQESETMVTKTEITKKQADTISKTALLPTQIERIHVCKHDEGKPCEIREIK